MKRNSTQAESTQPKKKKKSKTTTTTTKVYNQGSNTVPYSEYTVLSYQENGAWKQHVVLNSVLPQWSIYFSTKNIVAYQFPYLAYVTQSTNGSGVTVTGGVQGKQTVSFGGATTTTGGVTTTTGGVLGKTQFGGGSAKVEKVEIFKEEDVVETPRKKRRRKSHRPKKVEVKDVIVLNDNDVIDTMDVDEIPTGTESPTSLPQVNPEMINIRLGVEFPTSLPQVNPDIVLEDQKNDIAPPLFFDLSSNIPMRDQTNMNPVFDLSKDETDVKRDFTRRPSVVTPIPSVPARNNLSRGVSASSVSRDPIGTANRLLEETGISLFGDPELQNETINPISEEVKENVFSSIFEFLNEEEEEDPVELIEETNLMRHQRQGLHWLMRQEDTQGGGILADDMGLGKTIQILSLMVKNRPPKDVRHTGTLVICPMAVLTHWCNEVKRHFKPNTFNVYSYHGAKREKDPKKLKEYNVVVTTYGTLNADFRRHGINAPLHRRFWWRIILDEANNIKNAKTLTFKCVNNVNALRRWCLTGTPIENNLWDLFSLLRFVGAKTDDDYGYFKKNIVAAFEKGSVARKEKAAETLRGLVLPHMLHRKKTSIDSLTGETIIKLNEMKRRIIFVDLLEDEEIFISTLRKNMEMRFNSILEKGDKYIKELLMFLLVLILRLRQVSDHVFMLFLAQMKIEYRRPKDFDWRDHIQDAEAEFTEMVDEIRNNNLTRIDRLIHNLESTVEKFCYLCDEILERDFAEAPCAHTFCFDCADERKFERSKKCPYCKKELNPQSVEYHSSTMDEADEDDYKPANMFGVIELNSDSSDIDDPFSGLKTSTNEIIDMSISSDDDKPKKKKRRRRKSKKNGEKKKRKSKKSGSSSTKTDPIKKENTLLKQETIDSIEKVETIIKGESLPEKKIKKSLSIIDDESSDEFSGFDDFLNNLKEKIVEPIGKETKKYIDDCSEDNLFKPVKFSNSSKMLQLFTDIKKIQRKHPTDKCIIFSSFTTFLDLIEEKFLKFNWDYVRYDGTMTADERDFALDNFQNVDECKIFLCSLKAGGVGLNLTCANRVFLMDPWWNPSVDRQAIDRVNRIGQLKKVYVTRYISKNSIEEQIIQLQKFKQSLSDDILGTDTKTTARTMSNRIDDLRVLFSTATPDEDTNDGEVRVNRPRFGREEIAKF